MKDALKHIIINIFSIAWIIGLVIVSLGYTNERVAFLDLPDVTFSLIMQIAWPIVLSIVGVLIFPRLIGTVFVKLFDKKDKNKSIGVKPHNPQNLHWTTILSRCFTLFLLTIGLTTALVQISALDISKFITPSAFEGIESEGKNPLYTFLVLLRLLLMVLPLSISLLSIAWALEDAGIVKFAFPKEGETGFVTLTPFFQSFYSFIKGYAGLSSIIFYISAIVDYFQHDFGNAMDLLGLFLLVLIVVPALPAYSLTTIQKLSFLTKDLQKVKNLEKDDLLEK